MHWTSSYVFTIYAVGDGLFMQRVLNSVAALANSGVLASLGLLGMLLGLLMVVMKGISSGGKQVELPSLFMSFILYAVMFGGTAHVTIQDVGAPAGVYTNAAYTVDNVPFGVAAMGWMVSNVSYNLSEKFEQAFGLPDDTVGDVMSVGFDRSLDWLAAARYAAMPDMDDGNSHISRFRHNVVSYLRYCTPKAMDANPDQINSMRHASEPFDTTNGLGLNSSWDTFGYIDPKTGVSSESTCAAGVGLIQAYRDDGSNTGFFSSMVSAAAVPMGFSGTSSANAEALQAWQQIGANQDNATKFYANSLINSALHEAMAGVPIAGDMQVSNALMVDTADAQRAEKFAGEESLFRRMIRPMMAFFESLVYIAAPFMALVVGFGGLGVKMVGRYSLATIWVSMWMPTLAAINMYQETMTQEAFQPYLTPPSGTTGAAFHALSSLFGTAHAYSALDDIIATGSLLAASTPAITAFLLFGSAYALNGIWSGMQGGEFINQKMATPDPVSTSPAMNRSALANHNQFQGTTAAGATEMPKLTWQSSDSAATSRSMQAAETSMLSNSTMASKQVSASNTASQSHGARVGDTDSSQSAVNYRSSEAAMQSEGVDFKGMSSADRQIATNLSKGWSAKAGITAQMALAALGGESALAKGATGKAAAGEGPTFQGKGGVSPDLGVGAYSARDDNATQRASTIASVANSIGASAQKNTSVDAARTSASVAMAQNYAEQGFSSSQAVTKSAGFNQMARDSSQFSATFRDQQQAAGQASISQSVDMSSAVGQIAARGFGGQDFGGDPAKASAALKQTYMQHGGTDQGFKNAFNAVSGKVDDQHAVGAAALLAMNGDVAGHTIDPVSAEGRSMHERHQQLGAILAESGVLGVSPRGAESQDSPQRGALGSSAEHAAGKATAEVKSEHPGVSAGSVEGHVSGAAHTSSAGDRASLGGTSGMAGVLGKAEGGGSDAKAMFNADGSINKAQFDSKAAPVLAEAHANEQKIMDSKGSQVQTQQDAIGSDNLTKSMTDTGAEGARADAKSSGWMSKNSELQNDRLGLGGRTNEQAVFGQDQHGKPDTSHPENPAIASHVADAANGRYTGGVALAPDAASVIGTVAGVQHSQSPASAGQGSAAKANYEKMSPERQAAVNDVINHMTPGKPLPESPELLSSIGKLQGLPTMPDSLRTVAPTADGYSISKGEQHAIDEATQTKNGGGVGPDGMPYLPRFSAH